jgi:hypothetical protein
MELEEWKLSEQLSKSTITCLNSMMILLKETISAAKLVFRLVWKVPDDIWVAVFCHEPKLRTATCTATAQPPADSGPQQ